MSTDYLRTRAAIAKFNEGRCWRHDVVDALAEDRPDIVDPKFEDAVALVTMDDMFRLKGDDGVAAYFRACHGQND